MKKLFLFLLKKYSKTEEERFEIQSILHEQVCNTYSEQTPYGNVYNSYIEFLMGNPLANKLVDENNQPAIDMMAKGLSNAYLKAIKYLTLEKQAKEIFSPEKKRDIAEFIRQHVEETKNKKDGKKIY